MSPEKRKSWISSATRLSTRLVTAEQRKEVIAWLEQKECKASETEPGHRYDKFGELTEPWYLNGELIAILHTRPVVYGEGDFTIRLDCSLAVAKKLINEGIVDKKRSNRASRKYQIKEDPRLWGALKAH